MCKHPLCGLARKWSRTGRESRKELLPIFICDKITIHRDIITINSGVMIMEAGREIPVEQAFKKITELRYMNRKGRGR